MLLKDLERDERIIEWFVNKPFSASTKEFYLGSLKLYCDVMKMTPSELITEAIADIKSGKLMSERRIWNHITKYKAFLIQKYGTRANSKPVSTVAYRLSAIKSFYTTFEIDLPKSIKNGDTKPSPENMNSDFGLENIRQLLMYCSNIRDRSIILTMKSSGLARQEMINLDYKKFRMGYNREDRITTIRMIRAKVEVEFVTFIDPKGSNAIMEYLKKTGRLTPNGDFDIAFDNTPLFLSHRKPIRKIHEATFTEIFRYLSIKIGSHKPVKRRTKYCYNPNRSHNLRKFFNTQLKNSKIGDDRVELMLGHTGDKTKATYYLQNVQELRTLYKEHMHVLAIYPDRIDESGIFKENQKLIAEVERLTVEKTPESAYVDMLNDDAFVKKLFNKFKAMQM